MSNRRLLHLGNTHGCEGGNMSWGHVTSTDLLMWTITGKQPALSPDKQYDREGVFTGCLVPPTSTAGGPLTLFYSSIEQLPFHWSSSPYPCNAAGISMATSSDGGRTWKKSPSNPILQGEPAMLQVTGFRDPYVSEWRRLDTLRGERTNRYALVSGGIQGLAPTTFLYARERDRLNDWEYLGPLVQAPARWQASRKWSGNFGVNWECVNFMTLMVGSTAKDFLIVGAEGDVEKYHVGDHKLHSNLPARTVRGQLWMSGKLQKTKGNAIRFSHHSSGYLNHGCYYAANSFVDPKSGRRIVHGWIPEEDCSLEEARRKGWNGCLANPRELFLLTIKGVTRALRSPLDLCCV